MSCRANLPTLKLNKDASVPGTWPQQSENPSPGAPAVGVPRLYTRYGVLAVTCVAGNQDVDKVLQATFRVLDAADAPADLPVARGLLDAELHDDRGEQVHQRDRPDLI